MEAIQQELVPTKHNFYLCFEKFLSANKSDKKPACCCLFPLTAWHSSSACATDSKKKQIWTSKTGVHYNIITNPFIHCFLCIRSTTFWWLPSREPKGNKLVCATCWHFAFRITECTFSSYKFSLDQCFWLWDAVVPSCPVTKIGTSVLTSEFFNYLIIR